MKRSVGNENSGAAVARQPLHEHEWKFEAVPKDQLEACYLYEYGREFFKSSAILQKLRKKWEKYREHDNAGDLVAWDQACDLLKTNCGYFPRIRFDFFPATAWQDLPTDWPEYRPKSHQKDLRKWLAEGVNEESARNQKCPSDRFHIETLRQCEPPNIRTMEAFRDYHEWFHRKQDLGNAEYGFFAINWNFKNSQIIEAFTHWLKEQSEARRASGLKEAKPTVSRGGFRDKLNWLGALRVKNHYPHRDLVDYPSGRIKLGSKPYEYAPYAHYSELHENALKAEQEIARMFPKDWSEKDFWRRQAEQDRLLNEHPLVIPEAILRGDSKGVSSKS